MTDFTVYLSLIIPAYNEERRLPPTLVEAIDFLEAQKFTYEILVVDDGSSDKTVEVVQRFERLRPQVKVISLGKNQGKGAAVREGALQAKGSIIVFADADGSTPIAEFKRLEDVLKGGVDIAIGSRALPSTATKIIARWHRRLLGRVFNFVVARYLLLGFADTQCGFKAFKNPAAKFLFERQKLKGFSFDLEILYIAKKVGMRVVEVPVNWQHVPGSKVNLVLDAAWMFFDMLRIKFAHRKLSAEAFSES